MPSSASYRPSFPSVPTQVERLVDLGVHEIAGLTRAELADLASGLDGEGLLVVHPSLVAPSALTPLLRLGEREGFVVEDMTDLDEFAPIVGVDVPDAGLYVVRDVERGDDLLGWKPDDAVPEIVGRGRSPMTISEGISWLLQEPVALEANACFMCAGSRKVKATGGLDARTPALWISRGTGRDGRERKGAPKVGWCWAGNHHTWLGFASVASRG